MAEAEPDFIIATHRPLAPEAFVQAIRNLDFQNPKWLYDTVVDPAPWQGDVVPAAELAYIREDGTAVGFRGAAILVSHGCDTVPERDPVATLAPVVPLDRFVSSLPADLRGSQEGLLRGNRFTSKFFLPGYGETVDRYVDFAWAAAVSTRRIAKLFADCDPATRLRLSRNGWYLFTAKLTHHVAHEERQADYQRR
jgi:hypothetical protein